MKKCAYSKVNFFMISKLWWRLVQLTWACLNKQVVLINIRSTWQVYRMLKWKGKIKYPQGVLIECKYCSIDIWTILNLDSILDTVHAAILCVTTEKYRYPKINAPQSICTAKWGFRHWCFKVDSTIVDGSVDQQESLNVKHKNL